MTEKNRKNFPLNTNDVAAHFESDLKVWSPISSPWSTSFEYWWIKKELLKINGNFCMSCRMMKKQEIYLRAIQTTMTSPSYRELLNLNNYQILCEYCVKKQISKNNNVSFAHGNQKFFQIPSFFEFSDPHFDTIDALKLLKCRKTLEAQLKGSEDVDWSMLESEYKWAKIISQDHHLLISKAARKDDFRSRDTKYSAYLSLLKMKPQILQWHSTYTEHTFYEIYKLFDNPVRRYLVEKFGGISKTSKIYAATKAEFKQNPFMGQW